MNTLASLAAEEQGLCAYVASLSGTLEAKNQQLAAAAVVAAYKLIHQQYLSVYKAATQDSVRLEALKRLVFLTWYGTLEPSFLTGIGELDEAVMLEAYTLLDAHLRNQELDDELQWMLSYYSSWDYLLLHYAENRLPALAAFVLAVDNSVLHIPRRKLPLGTMDNRGQMGLYWQRLGVEQPR